MPSLLVGLGSGGEFKDDASIIILLAGGVEIEFRQRDLTRVTGREIEERGVEDRVVSDFELVSVFEDQKSGLKRSFGLGRRFVGSMP